MDQCKERYYHSDCSPEGEGGERGRGTDLGGGGEGWSGQAGGGAGTAASQESCAGAEEGRVEFRN